MPNEQNIEDEYCEWIDELKLGISLKLVFFSGIGWPDRTVLLKGGKIIFIEFKYGYNDLSPQQRYWRKIIKNLGFKYYVCYSTEEAKKVTRMALISKASSP